MVRERLAIEAKEAKATGKPDVEGLIIDAAMKKVTKPAEELGEPSHDMAAVKAHTSKLMGTLGPRSKRSWPGPPRSTSGSSPRCSWQKGRWAVSRRKDKGS